MGRVWADAVAARTTQSKSDDDSTADSTRHARRTRRGNADTAGAVMATTSSYPQHVTGNRARGNAGRMARLSNRAGANDNGTPTWQERRRRDSYGTPVDHVDDHDEDDDEQG